MPSPADIWTADDAAEAAKEGWSVVEIDADAANTAVRRVEPTCDIPALFNDAYAIALVRKRAAEGSPLHAKALRLHMSGEQVRNPRNLTLEQVKTLKDGDLLRCLIEVGGEDHEGTEHFLPAGQIGEVSGEVHLIGGPQGWGFNIGFIVPGYYDGEFPTETDNPFLFVVNTFDEGDVIHSPGAFPFEILTPEEAKAYAVQKAAWQEEALARAAALKTKQGRLDAIRAYIAAYNKALDNARLTYDSEEPVRLEPNGGDYKALAEGIEGLLDGVPAYAVYIIGEAR